MALLVIQFQFFRLFQLIRISFLNICTLSVHHLLSEQESQPGPIGIFHDSILG